MITSPKAHLLIAVTPVAIAKPCGLLACFEVTGGADEESERPCKCKGSLLSSGLRAVRFLAMGLTFYGWVGDGSSTQRGRPVQDCSLARGVLAALTSFRGLFFCTFFALFPHHGLIWSSGDRQGAFCYIQLLSRHSQPLSVV